MQKKAERYNKVFIVDQPGIGGLEITETGYLARFGPGFLLLCDTIYVSVNCFEVESTFLLGQ